MVRLLYRCLPHSVEFRFGCRFKSKDCRRLNLLPFPALKAQAKNKCGPIISHHSWFPRISVYAESTLMGLVYWTIAYFFFLCFHFIS
uniref:Uncharacterized protein n=1 Tax=Mus musculus TaxID=10090 RepID=Q3ULW2_MOUSE|nr:unnamed protein product [Mus musculus]